MKKLLVSLIFLLSISSFCFGTIIYCPNTNNSITGTAKNYCQNATATTISYVYNTCFSGSSGTAGVAMTITWYSNTTNTTTVGGTQVSTLNTNCPTTATGTTTYTPLTTTVGALYYYCVITWTGTGTCNTSGTLVSGFSGLITIETPLPAITGANSLCRAGASITLSNTTPSGTWSSSNLTAASITSGGVVNPSAASTGTTTISYVLSACGVAKVVTVMATSSTITLTPTSICVGATTAVTSNASFGSWISANTGVATTSSIGTSGTVTGVSAGTVVISYSTGGCGTTSTKTLTVLTTPAAIGGTASICEGGVSTLTNSVGSGTWSSVTGSVATIGSSGAVSAVSAGTSVISYLIGSCVATTIVTVNTQPAAVTGTQTICQGSTTTFANATGGGTWSTASGSIASINGSSPVTITGVSAGNTNISYTLSGGCSSSRAVTVFASPGVITGSLSLCAGHISSLFNSAGGGVWASVSTSVATIDATTGAVTPITAGTSVISYTVGGQCTATTTITVNTDPAAITGTQSVCASQTTTFANATGGGTWSTASGSIATIDGASPVTITGVSAGNTTISYTLGTGCFSVRSVTVFAGPTAITGTLSVCEANQTTLSNSVGGGAWTSVSTANATIDGTSGVVSAVSAGTSVISYTIGGICSVSATVTVNANPAAISGTQTVCTGAITTFANGTGGGTWSAGNGSIATIDGSSPVNITGIAAGNTNISYTLGTGCFSTRSITVIATPSAITGIMSVCEGQQTTLANGVAGGSWTSASTAIATIGSSSGIVTAVSAGTSVISYTNGGQCTVTTIVTVNANPAAISGTQTACEGAVTIFTDATGGGSWSTANGSIATIDGSSPVNITGVTPGTTTISYTLTSTGCYAARAVTIFAQPVAITGTLFGCAGIATTLSNATGGGVWSSVSTSVATINSATGVVSPLATGTSIISYTIGGLCASTAIYTVDVSPAAITGTQTLCVGGATTFADAIGGGTWNTADGSIATIDGSSPVNITALTTGNTTISYALGTGCFATRTISVFAVPATITGTLAACVGNLTTLSNSVPGGTWSSSNTARTTVVSGTGVVTAVAAGTSTISYSTGGSCVATKIFTVNPNPNAITGTQTFCEDGTTLFTDVSAGGTWSTANSSIADVDGSSPVNITGISAGSTNISYSLSTGCYVTRTVTVIAQPASITGTASACLGGVSTLSNLVGGGTWTSVTTTNATIDASSGVVSAVTAGTSVISYTISGLCSSTRIFTANANPAVISGTQTVCVGSITTFSDATGGGTWSTANSGTATVDASSPVNITGIASGNTTISYTLSTGCYATRSVTVSTTPTAITGTFAGCTGTTTTLSNSVGGGTWSSSLTAKATVGPSTGAVLAVSTGTATITYTIGSCFATKQFTVVSTPNAITGGTQSLCEGNITTYSDNTAGGTWSTGNASVATINASSPVGITGVSAGNTAISYSLSATCFATKTITVNASPAAITGSGTVCKAGTTSLADATGGGSWSSSANGTATVDAGGTVYGVNTNIVTISYTVSGCAATRTMTVLNNSVAPITGAQNVCAGSTITIGCSTNYGTWVSSNTGLATVGAFNLTNGIVSGLSAGDFTITYGTGCGVDQTRTFTVDPAPAAITGTSLACEGNATTLANSVGGGTWTSVSGSIATVGSGTGVVSAVAAGTSIISYTIGTCAATRIYTVNANPAAITGTQNLCNGSVTTFSDATGGGTWSTAGGSIATIDGASPVNITGLSVGNTTISYTLTTGCYASRGVTVNTAPVAITGSTTVCEGAAVTLINGTGGGSWSVTNGTGSASVISTGAVTGIAAGTVTVSYAIGSCYSTRAMTIYAQPGAIAGASYVCDGIPVTLSNAAPGGTWSSSVEDFATVNPVTGRVSEIAAGAFDILYTIGNCSATHPMNAYTVPDMPEAITGTTTICNGTTATLSDATGGGVWSSAAPSVATIIPGGAVTGITVGSATISYTLSNSCSSIAATTNVTILTTPTASISSATDPCVGYSTNIIFSGTSDADISYKVDGGSSVIQILSGGTFSLSSGVITGTHTYLLESVTDGTCSSTIDQTEDITPIPMTWQGGNPAHETEWNRAANWSCGFVPGASDDVTIPTTPAGGVFPILEASGTGTTKSLTIASGANVSLSNGATLNIKGNLINNGSVGGTGLLSMNNTSAQTISGTGFVNRFDLNNSAGATINTGSRLTINSVLYVSSGTLATNDSLVLNSTDTTTAARVEQLPFSGSAITGNVQVKQYIPGGYRRYRFWSQPFNAAISLGQVQNYIDITGVGGAANGFTTTGSNAASAFRYNPMMANSGLSGDPGWREFTNITTAAADTNKLNRYQGIRIFIRGQKGQSMGYATETPLPVTIVQQGVLNQGDQVVTLKKGSSANQDYNMVGNPFASPVNIGVIAANAKAAGQIVGSAFYVWNTFIGASGLFQAITINTVTPVNYYLQANECFQVRADHNNATLTFAESDKGSSRTINLMKAQPECVSLYIYDANYHPWDMLHIKFNDGASNAEDNDHDARKLMGDDFGFYSLSADHQKLCIDTRPYETEKTVPLGISSTYAQEYIIKAEGLVVPKDGSVYLHDKLLKKYVLLSQGTEYRFTITNDAQTQGENRFELSMKPAESVVADVKGLQVNMSPNPATDEVRINFKTDKKESISVRVLDMSGVSVYNEDLGMQQIGAVNVSLSSFAPGIYMVELTSGKDKVVQRLVKE